MIKPHAHAIDAILENIHLFGDFLVVLISWPIQSIYGWYKGFTFTFPWNSSAADEDLQSVSSDDSRPQSRLKQRPQAHTRQRSTISTGNAQDSVDGFGAHQIWYPPPPAYEEEDHSQVRPPLPSVPSLAPGLYPSTRGSDDWRKYPDCPAAYPLSPVLDPTPPPGFRIVAPVPKRPSEVIDIDNMSENESADDETRPGFHRSLLLSREFVNPDSVVRLSDQNSTRGVQPEEKTKKRKRMSLEDREKSAVTVGENAADTDEEMDEDGSEGEADVGDETFTTPRARTVAVDSDAEMGDASASEQEYSFGLQTPLLPRRNGKRTRSNLTIRSPSSTATLNPRKNAQDAKLKVKVYPASPPRSFPPHLSPISTKRSGSSVRSASTTLSTIAGGDSLMTGEGSEREEPETPSSPGLSSPYAVDGPTELYPPIPDVDSTLTVPVNVRGKRLFPRTNATSMRSRPPFQGVAASSSSSDTNSRASSWSRGSKRSQGLQVVARKKNVGGSRLTRSGVRPVAKGAENVPTTMPIPIPASDPEDSRKRKQIKDVSYADREMVTQSDSPLNKKQKIFPTSLQKVPNIGSELVPPPKQRPTAPHKPIRITKSTSSGMSASSSNLGARKKVGFVGDRKPVVRATRVRRGANESGG